MLSSSSKSITSSVSPTIRLHIRREEFVLLCQLNWPDLIFYLFFYSLFLSVTRSVDNSHVLKDAHSLRLKS